VASQGELKNTPSPRPSVADTAEKRLVRPSLRDLEMFGDDPSPAAAGLGYFHPSLRDAEPQILLEALGEDAMAGQAALPLNYGCYE